MDHEVITSTMAVFDGQELLARCMGNHDFARRILTRFQTRLQEDLAKLEEASLAGNAGQLAIIAHRLKGAAANVASHVLRDRAAEIEELARRETLSTIPFHLRQLQGECSRFTETVSQLSEEVVCNPELTESAPCESW